MSETDGYTTDGGTSYTASTRGFPQPRRVTRQQRLDAKRRETFTRERARPRKAWCASGPAPVRQRGRLGRLELLHPAHATSYCDQ